MNNDNILGYVHSFRFLRENAVPTVNLPTDSEISNLQNNYRSGIGNKTAKKVNNDWKIIIIFYSYHSLD